MNAIQKNRLRDSININDINIDKGIALAKREGLLEFITNVIWAITILITLISSTFIICRMHQKISMNIEHNRYGN